MILKSIEIENFMMFIGKHRIEIPNNTDVIGILGQWANEPSRSNESNKSAFIKAIIYNLYGYPTINTQALINNRTDKPMITKGVWDFNGVEVIITRGSNKKKNTIFEVKGYEDFDKGKLQKEIDKIIGFDFQTFIITSYFEQGEIDQILKSRSSEKKELILKWLENAKWFDWENDTKENIKDINKEINEISGKLKALEDFDIDLDTYKENIKLCDNKIKRLEKNIKKINDYLKKQQNIIDNHNKAIEKQKQIELYNNQVDQLKENIKSLENELNNIKENKKEIEKLNTELKLKEEEKNKIIEEEKIEREKLVNELIEKYNNLIKEKENLINIEKEKIKVKIEKLDNEIDNEAESNYEKYDNERNKLSEKIVQIRTEKGLLLDKYNKIKNLIKKAKCPIAEIDCPAVKNKDKIGDILNDVLNYIVKEGQKKAEEIKDYDIKINISSDKLLSLKEKIKNNNSINQEIHLLKNSNIETEKINIISKDIDNYEYKITNAKAQNLKEVDIQKCNYEIKAINEKIESFNIKKTEEEILNEIKNYNSRIDKGIKLILELQNFCQIHLNKNIEDNKIYYDKLINDKTSINDELIEIHKEKSGYEKDVKIYLENQDKIKLLNESIKILKKKENYLNYVKYIFGKNGIPKEQLFNAMGEVEDETNEILRKLKTNKKIEFTPDKETNVWEYNCTVCNTPFEKGERTHICKKCGADREKKRKEDFDIIIYENDKSLSFDLLSGGAKVLITFAVRLALSNLVLKRKGIQTGMLILDEPYTQLDTKNLNEIVNITVNQLKEIFNYNQIFVISHLPEVKNSIVDNLLVTRYDDRSEIKWM